MIHLQWALAFLGGLLIFGGIYPFGVAQAQFQVYLPIIMKAPFNPAKGVVVPATYSNCQDINALQVGWYYRNAVTPIPDCVVQNSRFVPRIVDGKHFTDDELAIAIANAQAGEGWLMGFVEPNYSAWGGYMTPAEGAVAWKRVEDAALPAGIKLVAPSPSQHAPGTNSEAGIGYTWIGEMIQEYKKLNGGSKPHFDAFAWNYYDKDPNKHKNFLIARRQDALNLGYDIPFWVVEYAGACWDTPYGESATGNTRVMTELTPWLDSTPWIARYAWFANRLSGSDPWAPGWRSCSLLDATTGGHTSLGLIYTYY